MSGPVTLEQVEEEEREEKERLDVGPGENIGEGGESNVEFSGKTVEELADELDDIAIPPIIEEKLSRIDDSVEKGSGIVATLLGQFSEPQDIDIGDINAQGTQALLRTLIRIQKQEISPKLTNITSFTEVIANVQGAQLSTLLEIQEAVEPPSLITVSGTNPINNTGSPQVVIPSSDEADIPTKKLIIRADPDNDAKIAFGDDQVSPASGFILRPGGSIVLPINTAEDQLYMAGDAGDQVQLIGLV